MIKKRLRKTVFFSCLLLGLNIAASAIAGPYTYRLDHFVMTGNLSGGVTDDFNDGTLDPTQWEIYDPTVIESGNTLQFQNPGTIDSMRLGNLQITTEMSYIHANWSLKDGAGDYQGTSTWLSTLPGTNQFYVMNLSSVGAVPDENVVIGVATFDFDVADFFDSPVGSMIFFGRTGDVANGDFDLQGYALTSADVMGDILLRLAFDDNLNQFSGSFSLDGGTNFITPFLDVAGTAELLTEAELTLGGESWDVQVVPVPPSLLLLFCGLAGIGVTRCFQGREKK